MPILRCPHCDTRVAPTKTGQCPACRQVIPQALAESGELEVAVDAAVLSGPEAQTALSRESDEPYRVNLAKARDQEWQRRRAGRWQQIRGSVLALAGLAVLVLLSCISPFNWLLAF